MLYTAGDYFQVCDLSSPFHEWDGKVIEVLDDGYYCLVDSWVDDTAYLSFDYFEESQMASSIYLG